MPIWLRRFIFSEIQNYYKEEKETSENNSNSNSKTVVDSNGKVKTPEFLSKQTLPKRPIKYN